MLTIDDLHEGAQPSTTVLFQLCLETLDFYAGIIVHHFCILLKSLEVFNRTDCSAKSEEDLLYDMSVQDFIFKTF